MRTSDHEAGKQFSVIIYPLLLSILALSSCATKDTEISYVTIHRGAEDDNWVIKVNWNTRLREISDTLFLLSPLIDSMRRAEYTENTNLENLFHKFRPHSILIAKKQVRGDSLFFQSGWYPIHNDSVKFNFAGHFISDSIVGLLATFYYAHDIKKWNSDTSTATFSRVQ